MAHAFGFIDPSVGRGTARMPLAALPLDLAGQVVGLLDNTKEQGEVILQTIAETLRQHYGIAGVLLRWKAHYSKPATQSLLDDMARDVQVAVAAVGGCGSCTLCCVHDTVACEKRGIPAVVIITQAFKNAAVF